MVNAGEHPSRGWWLHHQARNQIQLLTMKSRHSIEMNRLERILPGHEPRMPLNGLRKLRNAPKGVEIP